MTRKHYLPFFIAILVTIAFIVGRCEHGKPMPIHISRDSIINQVAGMMARRQAVTTIVAYKDSIRDRWNTKYKEIRYDSLIPCPEKLAIADTVIINDSSEIASLSALVGVQDSIIIGQGKIIQGDSVTIIDLKKDVRKQKRQKWLAIGATVIFGSAALR